MRSDREWSDQAFGGLLRQTAAYYSRKLRQKGAGPEGMDWRDRSSQYLRFERLVAHLSVTSGSSVLDVGCGDGELLAFLHEHVGPLDYLGIDVSEDMVDACNQRFGADTARAWSLAELVRRGRGFDWVIASGTFNVRQETQEDEWRRFFHRSVVEMFRLARNAAAFNVMSSRVDYRYAHLYYAEVQEMARLADSCGTRDFVIDHGYPLFEMTVTLRSGTSPGPR